VINNSIAYNSRTHTATNTGSSFFVNFTIPGPEHERLLTGATAVLENYEAGTLGRVDRDRPVAGGTVLGIHNLAIVLPQFIVLLATSIIFKTVDRSDQDDGMAHYGRNGVAWVLRFSGFCTLLGAIVARRLPSTKTEEEMRYILDELTTLNKEDMHP